MKISRANYELYFIDFIDGTLPADAVDDLLDFLNENPDLAEELSNLQDIKLEPDIDIFSGKSALFKTEFDRKNFFEQKCIESIEGLLSDDEQEAFSSYLLLHPSKKKEFNLFQVTISEPDLKIVYEGKERLKKRPRLLFYYLNSAAAILLVVLSIWFIESKTNKNAKFNAAVVAPNLKTSVFDSSKIAIETIASIDNLDAKAETTLKQKQIQNRSNKPIAQYKKSTIEEVKVAAKVEDSKVSATNFQSKKTPDAEYIEQLAMLTPKLKTRENRGSYIVGIDTATIEPTDRENRFDLKIHEAMAEKIAKFDGPAELNKIGKGLLDKVSKFTFKTIDYTTDSVGTVNEIAFNSAIGNFSVPIKRANQ